MHRPEPLTALDTLFLDLETPGTPMHVGAVLEYQGRAPSHAALCARMALVLERLPRFRRRLVSSAGGRPAWVDAGRIDLGRHVRVARAPPPGGAGGLAQVAARLLAAPLDRARPPWELWLVRGLGEGRFALVFKVHHALADGLAGVGLAEALHDRPAGPAGADRLDPGRLALATAPAGGLLRRLAWGPAAALGTARAAGALAALLARGPAPASVLAGGPGPARRWATARVALDDARRVRAALGGTVNDVVLAAVAGAVRRLLLARGEAPGPALRCFVPVSLRAAAARDAGGNQVAAVLCPLPVGEPDPVARLRLVAEAMAREKAGGALAARALLALRAVAPAPLATAIARLDAVTRWFNLVLTNVPGPQAPLALLGRPLTAWYPQVPLAPGHTLGVAVLSYHGVLGFGLLGDASRAADLPRLAEAIPAEVAELLRLARARERGGPPPIPSPAGGERRPRPAGRMAR